MTRRSRLYDLRRWRRFSADYLRANPFCDRCRERGHVVAASVVDHVVPHRGAPALFWSGPFQSLCTTCHAGPKQGEERTGRRRGCDATGRPFDRSRPVDAQADAEAETQGVWA